MTGVAPRLDAISRVLPPVRVTTEELVLTGRGHLSDKLVDMIGVLGVDSRYSVLANYPDVLFAGAEPEHATTASALAVRAARECVAKAGVCGEDVGLVLGVTSYPGRLAPTLVYDLIAAMPELPRTVPHLSLGYLGCSAIAKAIDTARWFLAAEPAKRVLVCFMEASTPLSIPLAGFYGHYSEVPPDQRRNTAQAMFGFLTGDAAVAMMLSADGDGPSFTGARHLTNDDASDTELGGIPDGGSDVPVVHGRRSYTLSASVRPRGEHYARTTVEALLSEEDLGFTEVSDASVVLLHTGSKHILDGLCDCFGIPRAADSVASSYRVLREYGNTIGCSVPLMLADPVRRPGGDGLLVAFGLGFSCGAIGVRFPDGWRP